MGWIGWIGLDFRVGVRYRAAYAANNNHSCRNGALVKWALVVVVLIRAKKTELPLALL